MNPEQFGKGAIVDRVDLRDHQWSEVGFGAAPFDWTKPYDIETLLGRKLPIKNQGAAGSCGGQAWSSYASALEALDDKTFEERSAKFIYAQTCVQPAGSYGRDNAEVFVKQGVAREAVLTSYENGLPPSEAFMQRSQDITTESRIDAALDKAFSYANVNCDINSVAQAIEANKGVILGVCGSNNGTWLNANPQPPTTVEWRHWVYAGKVRMLNGVKQIGLVNSWGDPVGESGWQWLNEDYFTSGNIFQVWTHVFNSTPSPAVFKHNFTKSMKYGENGAEVLALQTALQVDGTFTKLVAPTGFYGNITAKAVLDFQLKYALAEKNYLISLGGKNAGPLTLAKLNSLFNK